MSAHDYLWPARPEYLRYARPPQNAKPWLDLRDVTARAHAAMAWTVVEVDLVPVVMWRDHPGQAEIYEESGVVKREHCQILDILARMRMMDEAVTVAQAREALGWAERVAGVGDASP